MKNIYSLAILIGTSLGLCAQVGINTPNPQATLDIVGNGASTTTKDGVTLPRLTRQQLASKAAGTYVAAQTGTMVYISDATTPTGTTPSLAQTAEITNIGYHFFNGTVWKSVAGNSVNIYNADGSLTGPRVVTQGVNTLAFNGTAVNAFSVDGNTFSVDAANNRVGIGNTAPLADLHIGDGTTGATPTVRLTSNLNDFAGGGALQFLENNQGYGTIIRHHSADNAGGTQREGLYFNNLIANVESTTPTMMLDQASQRVGIGVALPTNKLHIDATNPIRAQGIQAGDPNTDRLMVVDGNGVLKSINTLSALSLPTPAIFRLNTGLTNFLNGVAAGNKQTVPMSVVKNTIDGLSYNTSTSTMTIPPGNYQMVFVYEATHNNTGCTLSSYIVDFPTGSSAVQRIHSTASHMEGGTSNHGGSITFTTQITATRDWQIQLGRGQSGNCSGTGMNLTGLSTHLLVFRIGDL
ncbi:hypothetical protein [Chryseobacterium luteum]|uniref:C1q domain-containing protein n=1 Tax=Chryseobacterium luteum TaxID=421531 RepID=A0A085ZEJ2_9FLAO|nr:hypothetical protein [Chryseobacterium luteum]KFF02856.1 hypothetical protein IX38_12925 [Chryseobacterium luteum]